MSARESYVSIRLAEAEELIEGLDAVTADLLDKVIGTTVKLAR